MIRPPFSAPMPGQAPPPTLTPRQAEVAALVAEGLSRRGIAAKLGVSEETVRAHLRAIALKLPGDERLWYRVRQWVEGDQQRAA